MWQRDLSAILVSWRLSSAERHDMLVPRTRTELSRRSFPVAALTVWNSLAAHLHLTLIGRRQFRDGLKSHLFADAYFWSSENIHYKSVMYLLTYLLTYLYPVCCSTNFIGCACLSKLATSSVSWSSELFMALHYDISVSSANQTPKTLLVLDSARQHTAISRFYVRRPTLVIMHLQSLGQHHGTDYQQQSGHLTLQYFKNQLKLPFSFLYRSSQMRAPLNWTECYSTSEINALLLRLTITITAVLTMLVIRIKYTAADHRSCLLIHNVS